MQRWSCCLALLLAASVGARAQRDAAPAPALPAPSAGPRSGGGPATGPATAAAAPAGAAALALRAVEAMDPGAMKQLLVDKQVDADQAMRAVIARIDDLRFESGTNAVSDMAVSMVKLLLDSGANPNAHPFADGRTLLHAVADMATGCFSGCGAAACCPPSPNVLKLAQTLADAGADVNALSARGITPVAELAAPGALYNICESPGYAELVSYLLSKGADPTVDSDWGTLLQAVEQNTVGVGTGSDPAASCPKLHKIVKDATDQWQSKATKG